MSRKLFARVMLAGGLIAGAAAPMAPAAVVEGPPVREVRIASGSAARGTTVSDLQGGHGVLVWQEFRTRGERTQEARIAALVGGKIRRSGWGRSTASLAVSRQVDERTGRVVVRVVAGCLANRPAKGCRTRLLSPTTLRETKTVFAEPVGPFDGRADGTASAVDGSTKVVASTVPDAQPDPARDPYLLPAASCTFALSGSSAALPAIPDCLPGRPVAGGGLQLDGGLLLSTSRVPSHTASDSYFALDRVDAFDLTRPQDGWRVIGTAGADKGGSNGIQRACVLRDGIAILDGVDDGYGPVRRETWSLTLDPLARGGARWSAPAPQLARPEEGEAVPIVCVGRAVHALITTYGEGLEVARTRVVRLERPR